MLDIKNQEEGTPTPEEEESPLKGTPEGEENAPETPEEEE